MSQGFLQSLRQRWAVVRKELEIYTKTFQGKDFLLKVEEASYRVEHFRTQAERLAAEITQGEEELARLREQELAEKQQLQNQFRAFCGGELRLS